jgi:drug/metabolite transporter (DMT)-like permease
VELTHGQRENPLRATGVLRVALLAAALTDIYRRPVGEIRGSRWLWSVVALVNFMGIGTIAYFAFGRKHA